MADLVVGMVPFVAGSNSTNLPMWLLMFAIIGPITLLSAVSAGGSLALSRRAEKLNFLDARAGVAKGGDRRAARRLQRVTPLLSEPPFRIERRSLGESERVPAVSVSCVDAIEAVSARDERDVYAIGRPSVHAVIRGRSCKLCQPSV